MRARALLLLAAAVALLGGLGAQSATAENTPTPVPVATAGPIVAPTTYRVDCSARRAGDGSARHPWRTLGAVNNHGGFLPGDRVLLRRGTTCTGRLHPSGSGAAGSPIVLGAYGSGAKPTVAGGGTPNFTGAVQLRNQRYWTIQDLHVTNTGGSVSTQVYRAGVSIRNQDGGLLPGIVVQRMSVDHVASAPNEKHGSSREWGGITAGAGGMGGDAFPGLTIRDNRISLVGRSGIFVANWEWPATSNTGVRITGNTVDRARGDGIALFGADHSRIDHNRVANSGDEWPCPFCGRITPNTANAGIWPARATDIRIDHNEVYGQKAEGGDGEAFDSDQNTDRILFEDNYAHDNAAGGILFCGSRNVTVRFNIFQNNRRSAFAFIGNVPADGTRIYNNTISASGIPRTKPVRTFNTDGNTPFGTVEFRNNIVYNGGSFDRGRWQWFAVKVTTAANTLVGVHGPGRPHDARTSRSDPRLRAPGSGRDGFASLSGYRPVRSGGPWGAAIPSDATHDFFGKRIDPKRPPRGAAG